MAAAGEAMEETERRKDESEEEIDCFSDSAIQNLKQRLLKEIAPEHHHHHLVFLMVKTFLSTDSTHSWQRLSVLDLNEVSQFGYNLPNELTQLTRYGCDVWKSKIIIAGGSNSSGSFASDKVYLYDTIQNTWNTCHMKLKRGHCPSVVVAGDRVFVFDGRPDAYSAFDEAFVSGEHDSVLSNVAQEFRDNYSDQEFFDGRAGSMLFCEYFDFDECGNPGSFDYLLPKPLPKVESLGETSINACAVYAKEHLILIWVSPEYILSLDYESFEWDIYLTLDTTPLPTAPLFDAYYWCHRFVVLEDFLFWSDHSTIYAFDLHSRKALPVYTFPHLKSFDTPFSFPDFSDNKNGRFLVPLGKGMLGLFCENSDGQVCFTTFMFAVHNGCSNSGFYLVLDGVGYLSTPEISLSDAFGISS